MSVSRSDPHADRVFRVVGHAPMPPARVQPAVESSWRRCLNEFQLDPARACPPAVLDGDRLKDLQEAHDELVRIARAEMDSLYEQIAGSGYALLLADASGVILAEKVDPALKGMFRSAGLIVGAEWSEQCEGTNGIGTCVREATPLTIHQDDHFRVLHTRLSCSAAPIHDPMGRMIAVLDASCVGAQGTREAQLHTVALVSASARLIEKCLFLRRHQGAALLRFHPRPEFIDLLHDGAISVAADGTILAADAMGLKLLGVHDRVEVVGRVLEEIFDASYEELLPAKDSTRRAIWEVRDQLHGRCYYARLVERGEAVAQAPVPVSPRAIVPVGPQAPAAALSLDDLAGEDPQMLRNVRNARRIADRNVSVIIRGPTGSGKEAFAKALHLASRRAAGPFVAVNCAAIPESLIESELFGYGPGAFTGARRTGLRGRIAQASGGTLFLDEIGDMPEASQTRLLRVLEEREVTPLGSEEMIKVDLRVICASHHKLRELIGRGRFREDLYYRLSGITIELPPLASRRDRAAVIQRCLAREAADSGEQASIESGALSLLQAYDWPGNVRELRNVIRTALSICEAGVVRIRDLPPEVRRFRGGRAMPPAGRASFEDAERAALLQALEENHWVMARVAAQLGISRNTLYRKLKLHQIGLQRPGGLPDIGGAS